MEELDAELDAVHMSNSFQPLEHHLDEPNVMEEVEKRTENTLQDEAIPSHEVQDPPDIHLFAEGNDVLDTNDDNVLDTSLCFGTDLTLQQSTNDIKTATAVAEEFEPHENNESETQTHKPTSSAEIPLSSPYAHIKLPSHLSHLLSNAKVEVVTASKEKKSKKVKKNKRNKAAMLENSDEPISGDDLDAGVDYSYDQITSFLGNNKKNKDTSPPFTRSASKKKYR